VVSYVSAEDLDAGLDHIRRSPHAAGTLELIVRRPAVDAREVLEEGTLDLEVGLVGDTWLDRGGYRTSAGADPDAQLTVMNARAAALVAGPIERWPLAGDQLYVDLDLSDEQLPAGSRLALGEAVIEITAKPHRGCAKFARRFGPDAVRFVNTATGAVLNLRGRNARVVVPGTIRRGDPVRRLPVSYEPASAAELGRQVG
jgi:MOSC domain-containing protein YiiM